MIASYKIHNNVWKVGEELGIPGQTVFVHLSKADVLIDRSLTKSEKESIKLFYEKEFTIGCETQFAIEPGRKVSTIVKYATENSLIPEGYEANKLAVIRADQQHKFQDINKPGRWSAGNHPKGFEGRCHTDGAKKVISAKSKSASAAKTSDERSAIALRGKETRLLRYGPSGKYISHNTYSRCRRGFREDLGIFVRSSWEANYARYLNYLIGNKTIVRWEYEPDVINLGDIVYTPDFKVWTTDNEYEYHEVKGWMDDKSKRKIESFAIALPDTKLTVINEPVYKQLSLTMAADITN